MITKAIYELLPSVYLAAGSSSVLFGQSTLGFAGGALLFSLGALIWVMRSNYRRQDQVKIIKKNFTLPETVYEFMPFLFLALGIILITLQFNALSYVIALVSLYRGASLLYLRQRYRSYAWNKTLPSR